MVNTKGRVGARAAGGVVIRDGWWWEGRWTVLVARDLVVGQNRGCGNIGGSAAGPHDTASSFHLRTHLYYLLSHRRHLHIPLFRSNEMRAR